jgi:hypothetical protein
MNIRTYLIAGLVVLAGCLAARADETPTATVGLPGQIHALVLPGSELEAKPVTDRKTPVVLRIIRVWPHGTAHRYDLEYVGLEPGTFNLRDYLVRKDGSSTADLPAIPVTINSVLPPGQVLPHDLTLQTTPRPGGYILALVAGGVLWLIGLVSILVLFRRRVPHESACARPLTIADRLRPLIDDALAGCGDPVRLAALERTLIAFWVRKLRLQDLEPAEALVELRQHPDAGPLLVQLESWLHKPGSSERVAPAGLLEPYRDLPAEALDAGVPA